jgi:hypothetical protein
MNHSLIILPIERLKNKFSKQKQKTTPPHTESRHENSSSKNFHDVLWKAKDLYTEEIILL